MKARAPAPPTFFRDTEEHRRQMRDYVVYLGEEELKNWSSQHISACASTLCFGVGNQPAFGTNPPGWRFDGVAVDESIFVGFALPHAWEPSINDRLYVDVHWCKSTSASGTVRWSVDMYFARPDIVIPAATTIASHTLIPSVSDSNTALEHLVTRVGPWTSPAGAKRMISLMQLTRLPGHANDTYGADAIELGVDLHFFAMGAYAPEIPS